MIPFNIKLLTFKTSIFTVFFIFRFHFLFGVIICKGRANYLMRHWLHIK